MRRFPAKTAGPPRPQTPRHCWDSKICDAVVLVSTWLGGVDGFCPDKGASKGNESGEVVYGFLAAQRDPLEALELADGLLDAGAAFVESTREKLRLGGNVAAVWNDRADAAPACRLAICPAVIALVADHGARRDVRADIEQCLEIAAVAGLSAGQVEGQGQAVEIAFQMDLGRKSAARAAKRLARLPPFAPAAETWARTIVESTI